MRKKLKIFMTALLMVSLLFSINVSTGFAATSKPKSLNLIEKSNLSAAEKSNLANLIKKYNLKVINQKDIPEGIEPIKVSDSAEADKVLNKNISTIQSINEKLKKAQYNASEQFGEVVAQATNTRCSNTYIGPVYWLNLDTSYTYLWSSSRATNYVSSVNSTSSYLTGVHPGVGWTQTSASGWPIANGLGIHAQCAGTWDAYLITPVGMVLVSSSPGSWSWDDYFTP